MSKEDRNLTNKSIRVLICFVIVAILVTVLLIYFNINRTGLEGYWYNPKDGDMLIISKEEIVSGFPQSEILSIGTILKKEKISDNKFNLFLKMDYLDEEPRVDVLFTITIDKKKIVFYEKDTFIAEYIRLGSTENEFYKKFRSIYQEQSE